MCCHYHEQTEREIRAILDRDGEITLYKHLTVYMQKGNIKVESTSNSFFWVPGVNKAICWAPGVNKAICPQGIHVYTQDKSLSTYAALKTIRIQVKVTCKKEHLIIAGAAHIDGDHLFSQQAVFTQVTITQKEWDNAVQPAIDKM